LAGGLLGVLITFGGIRTFEVLNPGGIPMADRIGVDMRVLVFALLLSLLTGLLFGLAPAWRASRMEMSSALKDSGPGSVGGRRKARLRSTLVVTEIALALVLLACAGLLFNSFLRMRSVNPGFDTDGIAVVPLRLEDEVFSGEQKLRFSDGVLERLEDFPGVESAAFSYSVPFLFFGGMISGSFSSSWYNEDGEEIRVRAQINPVTRDYFRLLGAEFRGRVFTDADIDMDPQPVVISGELAGRLYPGEDAIGRQFSSSSEQYLVIGVVSGLYHWGLDRGADVSIYIPWKMRAATSSRHTLMVRTSGDPGALLPSLRDIIWQVESGLPITQSFAMNDRINESLMGPRFISFLFLTFATLAILLAAGGIYGSMLYSVRQRRRELGIRAALGADRGRLIRMVLGQGALLTSIGIVIGLAGALAFTTTLESLIFGISTTDLPTFLIVVALLGAVAMVATFIPARRAVASDPVEVLRQE
jgi:putative ABC transport system permease protein